MCEVNFPQMSFDYSKIETETKAMPSEMVLAVKRANDMPFLIWVSVWRLMLETAYRNTNVDIAVDAHIWNGI